VALNGTSGEGRANHHQRTWWISRRADDGQADGRGRHDRTAVALLENRAPNKARTCHKGRTTVLRRLTLRKCRFYKGRAEASEIPRPPRSAWVTLWLLRGRPVVGMAEDSATIETPSGGQLTFYRRAAVTPLTLAHQNGDRFQVEPGRQSGAATSSDTAYRKLPCQSRVGKSISPNFR
jgi:hypothetical protein